MDVEQILKQTLDLTDFQILTYNSLLERTATAGQLRKRLNINRSTLYRVLEELVDLNLIVKKQIKTRMYFEALHPDSLKELYNQRLLAFEEKGRTLERVVHELLRKATSQPTDASITIEKGVQAHFRRMKMKLQCREKMIRQKANADASIYDYQKYPEGQDYMVFLQNFIKDRVQRDIRLRQLTHSNFSSKIKQYTRTDPLQLKEVRILPAEILPNVSFEVFDDYTIFTLRKGNPEDMVVITIRNDITAALMKSLFDFVFERSIETYNNNPIETFATNGKFELPKLGIGTSGVGGYWHGPHPYQDDIGDVDQIRHAISKGVTYLDTCLLYGGGHTVELVSKAVQNMPREDLFITGKLTSFNGGTLTSLREIEEQCDKYLKILKTEYLDQFQIHSRKRLGKIPHQEVIEKIEALIHAGKVKYWGVSNYTKADLSEAFTYSKISPLANEVPFGVFMRDYEENGTLDFMRKKNMTTISYFTIRKGGMLVDTHFGSDKDTLLQKLAEKYKKTPTQIAINWVISHPRTMALIKSTNGTHVNENVGAQGWEMSREDYQAISRL